MKKWIIRAPRMLDDMHTAAFKPTTGLLLLIAVAIFIANLKAQTVGLVVYLVAMLLGRSVSFPDIMNALTSSQGIMIFSLFITVMLTLFTLIYLKRIEKRPLMTAGISRGHIVPRYVVGFALGAAALLICFAPSMIGTNMHYKGLSVLIPVYLLAFIVQSSAEEVFFRGFLMTGISKRIGILFGVLISSGVFSLAHALNGGYSLLGGIYYALIGAFLALLMLRTNSIWASCGFHGAWNFTIGLLAPMSLGSGLPAVDYALFDVPQTTEPSYSILGDPFYLILIGVFLAAIALLLFVGKNKLIVRTPLLSVNGNETHRYLKE